MTDEMRTHKGTFISFDTHGENDFTFNLLGVHIDLNGQDMEALIELVGKVYYGAIEENTDSWIKRLVKEAILEERQENNKQAAVREAKVLERSMFNPHN